MAEHQTSPVAPIDDDYADMPELMSTADYLRSNLNAVIPSTRPANDKPIVVAFECNNTSNAEVMKCIICLEIRHEKTNEVVRLARCCKCPLHLSCVYKWLAAQYDSYVPKQMWGCPHCRAPVKDLATNTDPCILCNGKETNQVYYEPVAQAVPCCNASVHQQCLYTYIHQHFTEDRFPCPGCKTHLGAQRSMTMSIHAPDEDETRLEHIDLPPPPQYSGMMTERLQEHTGMMTRSRARGRGYQLHRGDERPVRRPYSDLS